MPFCDLFAQLVTLDILIINLLTKKNCKNLCFCMYHHYFNLPFLNFIFEKVTFIIMALEP